jgi:hypothetical protein
MSLRRFFVCAVAVSSAGCRSPRAPDPLARACAQAQAHGSARIRAVADSASNAPPGTAVFVVGRVWDDSLGRPLAHAQVQVRGLEAPAVTYATSDLQGLVRLTLQPGWPPQRYEVKAVALPYVRRVDTLPLPLPDGQRLEVRLWPSRSCVIQEPW